MTSPLILNREQSRRVDELAIKSYHMDELVLMENAGRGAAEIIAGIYWELPENSGHVVICCGKGNNGGDGFVIARHLDSWTIPVYVVFFNDSDNVALATEANCDIAGRAEIMIDEFDGPFEAEELNGALGEGTLLVDALLGTGAKGTPREPYARVIDAINARPGPIVAIDVPSGLDCDTGQPTEHTVRADHTITFVAAKPGFFTEAGKPYVGELHVVEIGVPRKLLDELRGS